MDDVLGKRMISDRDTFSKIISRHAAPSTHLVGLDLVLKGRIDLLKKLFVPVNIIACDDSL